MIDRIRSKFRDSSTARPAHRGHGIAMLLVIVTLATLAVMTAAYLSTHGNADAIAENATEAAETEQAAKAAADLAQAVLQSDVELTPAQIETIFANLPQDAVELTAKTTTLDGGAPTGAEEMLLVTTTATRGARRQSFQKFAHFDPEAKQFDLSGFDWMTSEFALFATGQLHLQDNSIVKRWSKSPQAERNLPLCIGSNSQLAGCVRLETGGAVANGHVYLSPDASASALDITSAVSGISTKTQLPAAVPILAVNVPDTSGISNKLFGGTSHDDGGSYIYDADTRFQFLQLNNDSQVTVSGDTTLYIEEHLRVDGGSLLRIAGDVTIVCDDNVQVLADAAISVDDGASLRLYVGKSLVVLDAAIGMSDAVREARDDAADSIAYADPAAVTIYGVSTSSFPKFLLMSDAAVRGRLHAPGFSIEMSGASALYGSALAANISLTEVAYVHYDHELFVEGGYCDADSPIYDLTEAEWTDLTSALAVGSVALARQTLEDSGLLPTEATPAADADAATARVEKRCITRPRPTKARDYEGRPLANADLDGG